MTDRSPLAHDRPVRRSEAEQRRLQRMFALHHGTVWRILRRRGLPEDVAADVTQQAFVLAAERLADIEATRERVFLVAHALKLAPPFFRIVPRAARSETRAAARPQSEPVGVQCCDLALAPLGAELAEVFVLYEIEGFSANEIALVLELPLARIAALLEQGRAHFRAAVATFESREPCQVQA